MRVLDALLELYETDFVFKRMYSQLTITSASGDNVPPACLKAIKDYKPLILSVMRSGEEYSAAAVLDLVEAKVEREAIQNEKSP